MNNKSLDSCLDISNAPFMKLLKALEKHRKKNKLTLETLGQHIGVSSFTVHRWLKAEKPRAPSNMAREKIEAYLLKCGVEVKP